MGTRALVAEGETIDANETMMPHLSLTPSTKLLSMFNPFAEQSSFQAQGAISDILKRPDFLRPRYYEPYQEEEKLDLLSSSALSFRMPFIQEIRTTDIVMKEDVPDVTLSIPDI